jgi:hypothetical protein
MMQRANLANDVALALYRADRLSKRAEFDDIPHAVRSTYQQIAEAAVLMVADPELREAADYFAAEMLQSEYGESVLSTLPLKQRIKLVRDAQLIVRRFLAFVRGEWPRAVDVYKQLAKDDKAEILALNEARAHSAVQPLQKLMTDHFGGKARA